MSEEELTMKSPLHSIHQRHTEAFTEYQGWVVPDHFTQPVREYWAVRDGVGVIDISYRATLRVAGPDRTDFLHRILSSDIKKLSARDSCPTVLLTAKGKIVSAMRVIVMADVVLLEAEPAARQELVDRLEMYKLMQKVEVEDISGSVVKLLIQGPKSTAFLGTLFDQERSLEREFQHQEFQLIDMPVRVVRVHETGEAGYEIIALAAKASRLWDLLFEAGARVGLEPVGFRAFNILRVEAGLPWDRVDIDDTSFPQEVRLDHTLDWEKGCYTGYEPVARIKFRGHINRKLMGLTFGEGVQVQSRDKILVQDRPVGQITSAVYSPRLNASIALGFVRREFCEPGVPVMVGAASGPVAATVAELPFYRGSAS
jgi:folate-binding protein YgfZ